MAKTFIIGAIYKVTPDGAGFLSGILKVGMIYIPVAIVEFLVYAPMLGVGGSYLSFLTGNVTNMKIPCVMNSQDIAGTEVGTTEHEIISTISVATSSACFNSSIASIIERNFTTLVTHKGSVRIVWRKLS